MAKHEESMQVDIPKPVDLTWKTYIRNEVQFTLDSIRDAAHIRMMNEDLKELRRNCDHDYEFSTRLFDECRTMNEYECKWCRQIYVGSEPPVKLPRE